MIFETKKLDSGDIDLYFKGTCFRLLRGKSAAQWVSYEGYNTSKRAFQLATATGKLYLDRKELDSCRIECVYPFGLFNTKHSVILAERKGARQALKGLCSNTLSLSSIEWIVKDVIPLPTPVESFMPIHLYFTQQDSLSPQFCEETFTTPEYPCLDEAKSQIRRGEVFARALSNSIALVPHHRSGDYLVFIHEIPVGELRAKDKLKVTHEEFRPELAAFFEPRGVTLSS